MKNFFLIVCALMISKIAFAQNSNPWPSSGNVGIGTTTPQSALQVVGTTGDPSGTAGTAAVTSLQSGSGTDLVFGGMGVSPYSAWIQHRHTSINNSYFPLSINPLGGNVGIGTTSPSSLFDVTSANPGGVSVTVRNTQSGTGSVSGLRIGNNSAVNLMEILTLSSAYTQYGPYFPDGSSVANEGTGGLSLGALNSSGNLRFYSGGNSDSHERIRIASNGNVGIGTTNPGNLLTIYNSGGGQYTQWHSSSTGAGSTDGLRIGLDGSSNAIIDNNEGTNLLIKNNGATAITVNSSQNIGIGTTDPQGYKLAVNGNMIAESVKVKLNSNWPDYVFKNNYSLQTLSEIEKYIQINKHLPGIPSAEQVKKEGLDLGEMNAKLLQKIEELTLHLIEQSKRSDKQDKLNVVLQNEINRFKSKP